jgi:hypothetical protein
MSKLMYALVGASALVAVASLASRFVVADTLSGSSGSSSSSNSSGSSGSSNSSCSSSGSGLNCCGAAPSLSVLWPPDHKMVAVTILGVTDVKIGSITQDEPIDALGSGNTAPDGSGKGTSTAYVRAERAGPGTGRIYFISFAGTDTAGVSCTGIVQVFVPHDQGQGFTPVDTKQRYDSTALVH